MKKFYTLFFIVFILINCIAVCAEESEPSLLVPEDSSVVDSTLEDLISKAVEVTGNQKAEIYSNVEVAVDLSDYDFGKSGGPGLFSEEEKTFDIYSCENNLFLSNGVLEGSVAISFKNELTVENAYIIMGIYDDSLLKYVEKRDIPSSGHMRFSGITAEINEDDYEIRFFVWDDKLKPMCEKFVYTAPENIRVYADTVNTLVDVPTYIHEDEILADINVFSGLGAVVEYDSDNDVLWIRKNNQRIGMYLYDNVMYVFKGETRYTSDAAYSTYIENDRIYVPLKAICNEFGFNVQYDEEKEKIDLFSNEVVDAQMKFRGFLDDMEGLFQPMPNLNYYSADINNGLIYFAVPESPYIYVTDGTNVIKYNVGREPKYILAEGDYIYYDYFENSRSYIRRINVNDNSIKTLVTTPSYIESNQFYYYNGKIYLRDSSRAYSASTGNLVDVYSSENYGDVSCRYETIVLDQNTVCNVVADSTNSYTRLTIKIIKQGVTVSSETYTLYGNTQLGNRSIGSIYNDNGLYIQVAGLGNSNNRIKVNLDANYIITSINEVTTEQWNNAASHERYYHSNFATTKYTNDYKFVVQNNVITALNRTTGSAIQLVNLKYRCNQLLFASDEYLVYCVQNVQQVTQDGNYYYRYTGSTGIYLVDIYEGTTKTLYSTY